ncbi:MAG: hypothetical protein HFJ28_02180 [Clostridia bacterium]|nr:hypothetical protein [Clostridia bacterium]
MIKKVMYITVIIVLILIFFMQINKVQAISITNITGGADSFVNSGKTGADNAINGQILNNTSSLIYNTLLIVGTCIAVLMAAVLGIKFITGSVEQKVKIKEALVPFLVGCIVIFSAFGIWRLVITVLR